MALKGAKGENEVCNFLEQIDNVEAKRNLSERRSGEKGDIDSNLPFEFEVKAKQQPSPYRAVAEAEESAQLNDDNVLPISFIKRKNGRGHKSDRLVVMNWPTFLTILEALLLTGNIGEIRSLLDES